jgi:L-fuculose-phosphate aldolase
MNENEKRCREQILEFGKLIYDKGYNVSIDGNMSIRLSENEILITPTCSRIGFISFEDLVVIDYDGNLIRGTKKPTSEFLLHTNIYKNRSDINAVIHTHAPNCLALSLADIDIEKELYITVAPIPTTDFAMPSSPESFEKLKPFIKNYNWAILRRHGVVAYESDLLGAFLRLEGMEHLAKVLISAFNITKPQPLSEKIKRKLLKFWNINN